MTWAGLLSLEKCFPPCLYPGQLLLPLDFEHYDLALRIYPAFGGEVSDPPTEEYRQVQASEDGGQDEKRETT